MIPEPVISGPKIAPLKVEKWMSDLKNEWIHLLANYGHVGFTFVAAIFVGLGGGILLDQKVFDGRTAPWFTFIGLAFGIAAGFKNLLDIVWRHQDKK
ncbi:MAG: AtpZ/AtpI family protein [Desulfoprunum sp.]